MAGTVGRPKTKGRKFNAKQACSYLGLKESTWRVYQSNGTLPEPDGRLSYAQGSFWYEVTLDNWKAARGRRKKIESEAPGHPHNGLVNRYAYDEAAKLIESGAWTVDVEHGIVHGGNLRAYSTGYLYMEFRAPDGSEYKVLCHRIIWEWQTGEYVPLEGRMAVVHKDEKRHHNCIHNLEAKEQYNTRKSWGYFPDSDG